MLDSLPVWGPEFEIHLEFKINSWIASYGSIFRFTATDEGCCDIGDRIPALWTQMGTTDKLLLRTQINDHGNDGWIEELGTFVPSIWYSLKISQRKDEVFFNAIFQNLKSISIFLE